jgi:hypothetical protein
MADRTVNFALIPTAIAVGFVLVALGGFAYGAAHTAHSKFPGYVAGGDSSIGATVTSGDPFTSGGLFRD